MEKDQPGVTCLGGQYLDTLNNGFWIWISRNWDQIMFQEHLNFRAMLIHSNMASKYLLVYYLFNTMGYHFLFLKLLFR